MSSLEPKNQSDIVSDLATQDEIRRKDPDRTATPPALVDDVDRAIIRLLQRDGRSSNTEIGRVLGLTETTIRKRIARLLGEDLISIVAVPTPQAVGMTTSAIIGISVQLQAIHAVWTGSSRSPRSATSDTPPAATT